MFKIGPRTRETSRHGGSINARIFGFWEKKRLVWNDVIYHWSVFEIRNFFIINSFYKFLFQLIFIAIITPFLSLVHSSTLQLLEFIY